MGVPQNMARVLVIGAGFSGSVAAERLASAGHKVLVRDKRSHIGGNAYDYRDSHGVQVHKYGPHLFHTNSEKVFEYLSRFTEWVPYEQRTLSCVDGVLYQIPINLTTLEKFFGRKVDISTLVETRDKIVTSEDVCLSRVGRVLTDQFFRGYTRKQWGLDLSELDASVAGRIPVRDNTDDRYFTDKFQVMPKDGYYALFSRMLDHPNIRVELEKSFMGIEGWDLVVYTGSLDEYFSCCYGRLPYRSLEFQHEYYEVESFQSASIINYPGLEPYTRIVEYKKITGQMHSGTTVVKEMPKSEGEPFYPVPNAKNEELCQRYIALSQRERKVLFLGRLAQYKYFNMDQVIAAALKKVEFYL